MAGRLDSVDVRIKNFVFFFNRNFSNQVRKFSIMNKTVLFGSFGFSQFSLAIYRFVNRLWFVPCFFFDFYKRVCEDRFYRCPFLFIHFCHDKCFATIYFVRLSIKCHPVYLMTV